MNMSSTLYKPNYLTLSRKDRLDALGVASTASGRPVHLLEKDIWIVWAIDALFWSDFGKHLVFKGRTSPSRTTRSISTMTRSRPA
jgi:hypothetical protein